MKELSPDLHLALREALSTYKPKRTSQQLASLLKRRIAALYSPTIFTTTNLAVGQRPPCDGFCGLELSKSYIVLRDDRRLCLTCAYYIADIFSLLRKPEVHLPIKPSEPSFEDTYQQELKPVGWVASLSRLLFGISKTAKARATARAHHSYNIRMQEYLEKMREYEPKKAAFLASQASWQKLWTE